MSKYILSIDVGGTQVKMGIFDAEGEVVSKWNIDTDRSNNGENIIKDFSGSAKDKIEELGLTSLDIAYIGVGVPGAVKDKKTVNKCVSLGWDVVNVSKMVSDLLFNIPVIVGNDANSAALGEMWAGAGKGYKNVVLLTIGTDIGGGVIIDGKPVVGAFGGGGELGHICINPKETKKHRCGKCGCFGQYTSATGLANLGSEALNKDVTAKDVVDLVNSGDNAAKEVFEKYCETFGWGLSIVASVVEPDMFILGGGVSKAGDILVEGVSKYYKKYVFHSSVDVKIVCASLFNDAGIYGNAYMALTAAKEEGRI